MRNTSLIPALFPENDVSEHEGVQFKRRDFLRTLGVVGVASAALALTPSSALAKPVVTASQWQKSCDDWRDCVMELVTAIYEGNSRGDRINEKLSNAKLYLNSEIDSGYVHDRYSARHVFRIEIDYDEVICTNGFMVKRLPFYGLTCGCPEEKDLNSPEISRITNARQYVTMDVFCRPTVIANPLARPIMLTIELRFAIPRITIRPTGLLHTSGTLSKRKQKRSFPFTV